jgi:hypothetical protein
MDYMRALWKHWIALASGVGSVVLAAIGTHYTTPLPSWTFWLMALLCFFWASFRAWREEHAALLMANAEIQRLRAPKYSAELLQRVRELYGIQDQNARDLLREIRLRGFMLETQATAFLRGRGSSQVGILNALEYNSNLIYREQGEQYRVNPEMHDALDKVLDEASKAGRAPRGAVGGSGP